jgi:hypothetical protein
MTTVVVSVVVSLLGSGLLATVVAKAFDARAASREDRRADAAADRALERSLKSTRATLAIERRKAQEATVDSMVGHAVTLITEAARTPVLSGLHVTYTLDRCVVTEADQGRLADTEEGQAVVVAFNSCRDVYHGVVFGTDRHIDVEALRNAIRALERPRRRTGAQLGLVLGSAYGAEYVRSLDLGSTARLAIHSAGSLPVVIHWPAQR